MRGVESPANRAAILEESGAFPIWNSHPKMGLWLNRPSLASKARQKQGLQSLDGKPRLFPSAS